jgi:hypothetical protein
LQHASKLEIPARKTAQFKNGRVHRNRFRRDVFIPLFPDEDGDLIVDGAGLIRSAGRTLL